MEAAFMTAQHDPASGLMQGFFEKNEGIPQFSPHSGVRYANVKATRHVLLFDVSQPEARAAYLKAIKGHVPDAFAKQSIKGSDPSDVLSKLIINAKKHLPPGVHYNFVHAMHASVFDSGGGFKFLVIPREIIPKTWEIGLTLHHQYGSEKQIVVDGKEVVTSDNQTMSHNSERLFFGLKTFQISALQRWTRKLGGCNEFNDLTLQATWGDSRVQRGGFNRRLIRRVNRYLGMNLNEAFLSIHGEDRQLQLIRTLDADAVDRLAAVAELPNGPGDLHTANAARKSHMRHSPIRNLVSRMHAAETQQNRVTLLQRFVQGHGLKGFAAVHHLLDGLPGDVILRTASSTYEKAVNGAEQMALKYLMPITSLHTGRTVAKRYKEVATALMNVQRAQRQIEDDPLLTDASRNSLRGALHGAEGKLHPLLAMPNDTRARLRGSLRGKLWQHTWQRNALTALKPRPAAAQSAVALAASGSILPPSKDAVRAAEEDVLMRLAEVNAVGYLLPAAQRQAELRELHAALAALAPLSVAQQAGQPAACMQPS